MIGAVIFDFTGVLVNGDPAHLRCFRQAGLTVKAYYRTYGDMDERTCTDLLLTKKCDGKCDEAQRRRSGNARPSYSATIPPGRSLRFWGGVVEFVRRRMRLPPRHRIGRPATANRSCIMRHLTRTGFRTHRGCGKLRTENLIQMLICSRVSGSTISEKHSGTSRRREVLDKKPIGSCREVAVHAASTVVLLGFSLGLVYWTSPPKGHRLQKRALRKVSL
jgi:hypothetical protein